MKNKFIAIFTFLLVFGFVSNANAATFTLSATEDADFYSANNTINNDNTFFSRVNDSSFDNSLLKFNVSTNAALETALQNQIIVSVQLNIYNKYTNNDTDTKVFYLQDDSWIEGIYGTSHAASVPVFDSNKSLGDLITVSDGGNNRAWVSSNLNISPFLADLALNNKTFSLLLSNRAASNSYDTFFSKEQSGGSYTPYLIIGTAPAPTPEPSSMMLGIMGICGLFKLRKKAS